MRRSVLTVIALALVPFVAALAQESLCNPCVDAPVNRIRREEWIEFNPPTRTNATVIVTAEDMRNLGIRSVAGTASNTAGSPYGRPISLGDADAFPGEFASVFAAAGNHIELLDYEPAEYVARLAVCNEGRCILVAYPAELGNASATTVRECPVGYCATMIYSLPEGRFVEIQD